MRQRRWLLGVLLVVAAVYFHNAAWRVSPTGPPRLLAHRGLGQAYSRVGLTGETCTAARMIETGHPYLENTIASMRAAFALGADVVEFDIHPTTDDRFAVFHDWTLDCRTNGTGVTREHTLAELQALDIGHGYTADSGATYPFRGTATGLMPSLTQVLDAFPLERLLIDVKGGSEREGRLLVAHLESIPESRRARLMVYGGGGAVNLIREGFPEIKTIWPRRLKQCLIRYALVGWTGHVPEACSGSIVTVPVNVAPWLWGWPHRFVSRMEGVGSEVFVLGPYHGGPHSTPLDDPERLKDIPERFDGGIWTDRVDVMGRAVTVGR